MKAQSPSGATAETSVEDYAFAEDASEATFFSVLNLSVKRLESLYLKTFSY